MTSFYDRHILPRLVNMACGSAMASEERRKVVPLAEGVVVEVGIGSGLNLPFYDPDKVKHVIGVDPADEMHALGRDRFDQAVVSVERISAPGEALPLEAACADTALLTFTGCTIPGIGEALGELRRVLKPSGRLLFLEHGRSSDANIARWQDRWNPVWKKLAGGCNINRDMAALIRDSGFEIEQLETYYTQPFPRIATFHYRGSARPG